VGGDRVRVVAFIICLISTADVTLRIGFGYPIYVPAAAAISYFGFRLRRAIIENPHSRLGD
jgi:hypothetical protein